MTPTEQVHAILEYKGWTVEHKTFTYDGDTKPYDWWNHTDGRTMGGDKLPNLLHSLDACHEVFEKDAPKKYWIILRQVTSSQINPIEGLSDLDYEIAFAKATCAQRVEAMVRAIGQWKDFTPPVAG